MEWASLVGGAAGAAIALAGTVVNEVLRGREQRRRKREAERSRAAVEFILAVDAAHAGLREVAQEAASGEARRRAAGRAVHDARAYRARELLLLHGSTTLVTAGERAWRALVAIRDAVGGGSDLHSFEYHRRYHPFEEAIWNLRAAIRANHDQSLLRPATLALTAFSGSESCTRCNNASIKIS